MEELSLFSLPIILFLIMDPVGNIPAYLTLVEKFSPQRQKKILFREMLIALALMIVFAFLGEALFYILQVSDITVMLSSGAILFLTAIKILFPTSDSLRANLPQQEPFIIPLAVPLIAGPSALATIMLFSKITTLGEMLIGITIAWISSLIVLYLAPFLQKYLRNSGLMACERLMGMILVMLAIQRFMEGIHHFVCPIQH